jgi:hypothetical protein
MAMPLATLITSIVMEQSGLSANVMSAGGLRVESSMEKGYISLRAKPGMMMVGRSVSTEPAPMRRWRHELFQGHCRTCSLRYRIHGHGM